MPFTTNPPTTAYTPAHALPQHLDHKPVFALPYRAFDGLLAGVSDVQFVSIGLAQYNPDEVSVKTMRHTGAKWTRQAEELPLNRVIDMTLFLAKAVFDVHGGTVTLPAGTLDGQASDITVQQEHRSFGESASYRAAISLLEPQLKARLNVLLDVLKDLSKRGQI